MSKILLVEDDSSLLEVLAFHLEEAGHEVLRADGGQRAVDLLKKKTVDLVLTDIRMPGLDGKALLRVVHGRDPDLPVVVMTAYGTIGDAVEAMRLGAVDYLTKPVTRETLLLTVEKAARVERLAKENRSLKKALHKQDPEMGIIGTSAAVQQVMASVRQVAPTDATVMITGESGTGKELVARTLHALSPRNGRPFVALNCAAFPKELLESELFGHQKGSFTGATDSKPGKFQLADGGTLFLDEIGDMDVALQGKILRALQERVVDPIGAKVSVKVDVRIVSATHRDLAAAARAGSFRQDLFWRLNVIPIHVPPLRERPEDIVLLLSHFYRKFGVGEIRISREAVEVLENYAWPGNIRELQNLGQRLAILHPGEEITPQLLPPFLTQDEEMQTSLWGVERETILRALRMAGGNQSKAARALKIPRHILRYRMKKHHIDLQHPQGGLARGEEEHSPDEGE